MFCNLSVIKYCIVLSYLKFKVREGKQGDPDKVAHYEPSHSPHVDLH